MGRKEPRCAPQREGRKEGQGARLEKGDGGRIRTSDMAADGPGISFRGGVPAVSSSNQLSYTIIEAGWITSRGPLLPDSIHALR